MLPFPGGEDQYPPILAPLWTSPAGISVDELYVFITSSKSCTGACKIYELFPLSGPFSGGLLTSS